jgi:hypothetical protein
MSAAIATRELVTIDCTGTPRERGRMHGETGRALVRAGLDRWLASLAATHRTDPDDYLRDFLAATGYVATIAQWTPALFEEMRGIAEGADVPFAHLLPYNLLDEEWAFARVRRRAKHVSPGCTVACLRPVDGPPVLAQTMDIPSLHDGTQAVVRIRPDDGPEVIVFTYAGMIGLNGCNAAGVGVVVNNLEVLTPSPTGLPVAFVTRGILERSTLAEAAAFVRAVPHAIGQHYAISDPTGLASLEGSAGGVGEDTAVGDRLLHTNHPLVSTDLHGDPERIYARYHTRERLAFVAARSEALTSRAALEGVLADTTVPISLSPDRPSMTFGAVAMELSVPPRLRIAPGPPHTTPFVDVPFST